MKSTSGYVAKFPYDSLALITDFTATASIMSIDSVSTLTSISVTLTLQNPADTVANYTSSVTVQDVTYSSAIQYIPDVYYQTNNQTFSMLESTFVT